MELLDQLEEKIILALETIELLRMENEELKDEVSELKNQNVELDSQQSAWEVKVASILGQFEEEAVEEDEEDEVENA
jgi:cell division protein ZapB